MENQGWWRTHCMFGPFGHQPLCAEHTRTHRPQSLNVVGRSKSFRPDSESTFEQTLGHWKKRGEKDVRGACCVREDV